LSILLFPLLIWGQSIYSVTVSPAYTIKAGTNFEVSIDVQHPNGCLKGVSITNYKITSGTYLDLDVSYSFSSGPCTQATVYLSASKTLQINTVGVYTLRINGGVYLAGGESPIKITITPGSTLKDSPPICLDGETGLFNDLSPNFPVNTGIVQWCKSSYRTNDRWKLWNASSLDAKLQSNPAIGISAAIQNGTDVLYNLGDKTTGIHEINIETSFSNVALNFQYSYNSIPNHAFQVYLSTDYKGSIKVGSSTIKNFLFEPRVALGSFVVATIPIQFIVDMNQDLVTMTINGTQIHSWRYSSGNSTVPKTLGAVNFWGNQTYQYALLDACVSEETSSCQNATRIECGSQINSTTLGKTNQFDRSDYSCLSSSYLYDAPDQVFVVNKTSSSGDLVVTLFSQNINHDIFVLDNCSDFTPRFNEVSEKSKYRASCIGKSTNDLSNNGANYEVIRLPNLAAGTYYIVVDGYNQAQAGPFTLGVTCEDLSCSNAQVLTCGRPLTGQTTTNGVNNVSSYCSTAAPQTAGGWGCTGKEKVYYFDVAKTEKYTITLKPDNNSVDLGLFLLNACSQDACVVGGMSAANGPGAAEIIEITLSSGRYYVVVDGFKGSEGGFTLSLTKSLCEAATDVNNPCNTLLRDEHFLSVTNCIEQYNCVGAASSYPGREKIYKITLNSTTSLQVGLHSSSISSLDLFLLRGDDCSQINCIRKGSVSEISNSKYISESLLAAGTYYIVVDGTGNNQNATYTIDFACAELACGNSTALSCKASSNSTLFSGGSNNVSIYGIKQANGTTKYYPGFTGKEKVYVLEVFETQNISINLRTIVLGEISGDPTLFLLKSCSKTDGLAISMTPGYASERISMELTPGTYYVVVDEYLNSYANFELSISQTQACANICEYGSTAVYRGVTVVNNLSSNELAPSLLYSESCIRDAFGSNLSGKKLYADIYTFYNDEAGRPIILSLTSSSNSTTRGFIFQCSSLNATCRGVTSNGILNLGNSPVGYYYVVIISTSNPSYSFNITPNGVCQANPETITPNAPAIARTVSGKVDNFNIGGGQYNGYSSCYNGSRGYQGEDLEFQFTVENAVKATITLSANTAMGVFLYGYICGKGCINYAETAANGGTTQIVDFQLSAGTYFIIVDKSSLGGNGNFTIQIETKRDINFSIFGNEETCPQDGTITHTVRIPKMNINYFNNESSIYFLYPKAPKVWRQSREGKWDTDPARSTMSFSLSADLAGGEKCSYTEGDSIYIGILKGNSVEFLKPTYDRVDQNPSVNAASRFKARGTSNISRFELTKPSHFYPSLRVITVSSLRDDTFADFDFSTSDPFYIKIEPAASWVSIQEEGAPHSESNPYSPQDTKITIRIAKNTTGTPRQDVKIIFISTGPIPFQNEVLVQQKVCAPFSVSLNSSTTSTCTGQTVNLRTNVSTGNLSDYTFNWSHSSRTDPTIDVEASRSGAEVYTVTVTGSESQCRVEKTAQVIVNYIAAPSPPTAVQSSVSACVNSVVPTLSVNTIAGLNVNWYNGSGPNAILLQANSKTYTPTPFSQPGDYYFYAETRNSTNCASSRIPIRVSISSTQSTDGRIELNHSGTEVCAGSFVELKAVLNSGSAANYNFEWSNGSSNSSIPFNNIAPGDYALSVRISAKAGICSSPKTISTTFKVVAKPTLPVIPSVISTCSGTQAEIITTNVPAGTNINWYSSSGAFISKGSSFQAPLINAPGEYIFYAEAFNERLPGCTSETIREIKLSVQTNTTVGGTIVTSTTGGAIVTNSSTACLGTPLQLYAVPSTGSTTGFSFKWSNEVSGSNINANTDRVGTQTYTVSITNNNLKCQTALPIPITIEVKALPEDPVPLEAMKTICQGTLTSLAVKATAGSAMQWYTSLSKTENPFLSNMNTYTLTNPLPVGEKDFYVEARNSNGCVSKNRIPLKLIVNSTRSVEGSFTADAGSQKLCQGEILQVSFKPATGTLSDYKLEWTDNSFAGASRTIPTTNAGEYLYKLKVTGAQGTCFDAKEFTYPVSVLAIPQLTASVPDINTICLSQQNVQLSLKTSANALVDWYDQNQMLLTKNANPFTPNLAAGEYTYFAQLRSAEGCINKQKIAYNLQVYPKLTLSRGLAEYPVLCYGRNDGVIQVRLNESNIGTVRYNWLDRPGLNVPRRTGLKAGIYSVEVSFGTGCTQSFSVDLKQPDSIDIKVKQVLADSSQSRSGGINVEVSGGISPYSFIWRRNGRTISYEQNLSKVPADVYQLEVIDANNCSKLSSPIAVPSSTIGTSTGTQEHPWLSLIKVSPNPSDGVFYLTLDLPEQVSMDIEVVNQLGQRIMKLPGRSLFKSKIDINLQHQDAGAYFIKMAFAQGVITKRILLVK